MSERRFEQLYFYDQYKEKHLLPLFLSKITPPDSNFIEFDPATGNLIRGIRTMGEVAHFVRSIPYKPNEFPKIWSSPDFLLTMRIGTVEEHALLLASMFRAVKYETTADIEKAFATKRLEALSRNPDNKLIASEEQALEKDEDPSKGILDTKLI